MIEFREGVEQSEWKDFLNSSKYSPFQQSWEWGAFQEALGKKIYRWGIYSEGILIGVCLGIVESSRFGNIIYCPRGPVIEWSSVSHVDSVLKKMVEHVNEVCHPIFLRVDPSVVDLDGGISRSFKSIGFHDSLALWQVKRAWILEIGGKSDDELLSGMRKNSRYYLRKAMKSGVEVSRSEKIEEVRVIAEMLGKMSGRKGFAPMPVSYLLKQFEVLGGENGFLRMYLAKRKGEIVAGAIISFWNGEASYLHGASDELGQSQAPYLLQWEAIRDARDEGFARYNFWGVVKDEDYNPSHPGFGYSNFKRGFGGGVEEYIGGKDYVYKNLNYLLFKIQERIRTLMYKGN